MGEPGTLWVPGFFVNRCTALRPPPAVYFNKVILPVRTRPPATRRVK